VISTRAARLTLIKEADVREVVVKAPLLLLLAREPDGDLKVHDGGADGEGEAGEEGGKVLVDALWTLLLVDETVGRRGGQTVGVVGGTELNERPTRDALKHDDVIAFSQLCCQTNFH
jgi:hypothetical protein